MTHRSSLALAVSLCLGAVALDADETQQAAAAEASQAAAPSEQVGEPSAEVAADPRQAERDAAQQRFEELKAALETMQAEGETLERLEKVGDLYLSLGQVPQAVVAYEKAIKDHEGSEALFYKLARTLLYGGRPELALKILQLAVEAYPDSGRLHLELGKAYNGTGRHYAAISTLSKAAELMPEENVFARYHLADAYKKQGKWGEAEAIVDQLIEEGSENLPVHVMKAELELVQGDPRTAAELLEELKAQHPDSPEIRPVLLPAYQQYAKSEATAGRVDHAIELVEKAMEIAPNEPTLIAALGAYRYETGDHDAAEARLKELTEKHPDFLDGYALYGTVLKLRSREEEARAAFRQGLQKAQAAKSEQYVKRYQDLLNQP